MDVGGRQAGNGDQQRGSSAQQGLHPERLLCGACGSGAKSPIVAGAGKPGNRQAVVTVGGPETCGTAGAVEIGRAHVLTPVTNAHLVCRLLLEKKKNTTYR